MNTYSTVILTIAAIITLVAAGLALDTYLKFRFERESIQYSLAHIGIIWGVLIGTLLLGGVSTAAVATWLSTHAFLTMMILLSAYAASINEAFRQRSHVFALVPSLVFVGISHYVTHSGWLTALWITVAIVVFLASCDHINKLINCDEDNANTSPAPASGAPAPTSRVIWRRATIPAHQDNDGANDWNDTPIDEPPVEPEVTFQQSQRGYAGSAVPRPHEPTFKAFTETTTKT